MKKFGLLFLLFFITASVSFTQILTFEFSALAGDELSANSNTNDINLTSSTITRGSGVAAAVNAGRFNSTGWATVASVDLNDYLEFSITPTSGSSFSITTITMQHQRSGTGPVNFVLRTSSDGYVSNLDGVKTIGDVTTTISTIFTLNLSSISTALAIRIYGYSAEGAAGSWGIGDGTGNDLVVNGSTSAGGPSPTLNVIPVTLTGFTYVFGSGPSASQSYVLSGTSLDGSDVTITVPTNYEISLDDNTYTNEITLSAYDGTDTDIYVRLIAVLTVGTYDNEDIVNDGGGANAVNVTCNGSVTSAGGIADHVVIAEIYGGGGNSGSYYTNDYIVLFNPTGSNIDLTPWSIQYTSAAGAWGSLITNLSGTISANSYYLIQQAAGVGGTNPLPITPNVIGTIAMSATTGKLALVNDQVQISGIGDLNVVDFVGYGTSANEFEGSGPAPAPSNTSSIRRKDNNNNNTYGTNGSGWDSNDNTSDFYIENDLITNAPLPVELASFSASVVNNNVKLNWRTETEVNNYGFEILRYAQNDKADGWEKIGFVNGNGNSNSPKSYSYEDKNVTAGKYSYRLKQIDNDGQFEYSKTIEVDLGAPKKFELSQNYPNPFNPTTTIKFNLPEAGNVKLTLFNILGQELKTLVNEFKESGVHTINFDASDLNSGMYIYKLEAGSFVQTRKMTLVK
ncbi:MAG: T9SS type A sorting domain-containing protein [Ignavibacterium sp.]|nr:T9SS type A sorting domain-containing protein [Ignavibacterium sp.]